MDDELATSVEQQLLGTYLDLSPDAAVVVDGSGRIVAANELSEQLFGYSSEELVGVSIETLVPERVRDSHARLREKYAADAHRRPMGAGLDLRGRRKDGSEVAVDISLAPMPDEGRGQLVVAAVRDVTVQRAASRAEARLAAIVRSSDAAMLSTTPDLLVDSWNPAASRLFGHREEEILGRPIDVLVPDDLRDQMRQTYLQVSAGDRIDTLDTTRLHSDGHVFSVAVSVSGMVDHTGASLGVCEVVRDQTERLQIRAELAAAEAERRVYADRERIARDLHDRVIQRIFAAGMGLQGLRGLVGSPELSARLATLTEELDAAVRDIRTSIFTLRRGPDDTSFRGQLIDIGEHTAEALGFRPRFTFRGPVDLATPAHVAEQAGAVVREALANVAKHAHATSAEVTVSADTARFTITVADNGRGLPGGTRRSGLRNLAERAESLGGVFRIEAASGGGTCLTWDVPLPAPAGG